MSIGEKCFCPAGTSFTDKRNAPHAQRVTVPVCKAVRRRALFERVANHQVREFLLVKDGGISVKARRACPSIPDRPKKSIDRL